MPIEIKEIVVKTQVDNSQVNANNGLSPEEISKILAEFKRDIMNEISQAMFNQMSKNEER